MKKSFTAEDEHWMDLAIRLGRRGLGKCRGNPSVGAVLVKEGRCVGAGYHDWDRVEHAEAWALRRAGEEAWGASCYVTLEPCAHTGRTPPCCDALKGAGVARVVYGISDPSPHASGDGPRRLREAGLEVDDGCREKECRDLTRGFLHAARTGRALLTAKAACGPDGRLATVSGESQWLSSETSRRLYRRLRGLYDAVAIGVGTALHDNPHLGSPEDGAAPAAVVLDGLLRLPPQSQLVERAKNGVEVLLYCRPGPPEDRRTALKEAGVTVVAVPAGTAARGVDLEAVARDLAGRGLLSVLVEGGSLVLGDLFDCRLADRLLLFQAPVLLGGAAAPQIWAGRGSPDLSSAPRLVDADTFSLEADGVLDAGIEWPELDAAAAGAEEA